MNTVKDERQHMLDIAYNDEQFNKKIANIHSKAATQIKNFMNDFYLAHANNGILSADELTKRVSTQDKLKLTEIVKRLKKTAGNDDLKRIDYYRASGTINNQYLIAALIGLYMVVATRQVNDVMLDHWHTDYIEEMSYQQNNLSNSNFQLVQQLELINKTTENVKPTDRAWQINDVTAMALSTMFVSKIRSGMTSKKLIELGNNAHIETAMLAKNSRLAIPRETISGALTAQQWKIERLQRTESAYIRTNEKLAIFKSVDIKRVMIVNEFGACLKCLPMVGRIFDIIDADDLLPQHPNCRCELMPIDNDLNDLQAGLLAGSVLDEQTDTENDNVEDENDKIETEDAVVKLYDQHKPLIKFESNAITEEYQEGVLTSKRYFDAAGQVYKQIDYTNHGNAKRHPYVPHIHYYEWQNGKIINKTQGVQITNDPK